MIVKSNSKDVFWGFAIFRGVKKSNNPSGELNCWCFGFQFRKILSWPFGESNKGCKKAASQNRLNFTNKYFKRKQIREG